VIAVPSFERFIVNGPDTGHFMGKLNTRWASALCTRPMEAELLQIAKEAQVRGPVWDLVTLKANVPLNKPRVAFQAGQFQESITQAKNSLLIKPDLAPAYWGIGISYGRLGQWDLAITNLEAALKIEDNYGNAKESLKWAKEGQKSAKDGKGPKAQSPEWN
jgi:tetratricopeptide (TPR) repeat protein